MIAGCQRDAIAVAERQRSDPTAVEDQRAQAMIEADLATLALQIADRRIDESRSESFDR